MASAADKHNRKTSSLPSPLDTTLLPSVPAPLDFCSQNEHRTCRDFQSHTYATPENTADLLNLLGDSVVTSPDVPDLQFQQDTDGSEKSESDIDPCEHPSDFVWDCDSLETAHGCPCSRLTPRGLPFNKVIDLCESMLGFFHPGSSCDPSIREPLKITIPNVLTSSGDGTLRTPKPSPFPRKALEDQFSPALPQAQFKGRRRALIIAIQYRGQFWPLTDPPTDPLVTPIDSPATPAGESRGRPWWRRRGNDAGVPASMELTTHQDAKSIKEFIKRYGYRDEDIRMLMDDDTLEANLQPTKANIEDGMKWLADGARAEDRLFFYYAGHGEQVEDLDGDEKDGKDEAIIPIDHQDDPARWIIDDKIFEIMVKPLPRHCQLTALVDCCHSGTVLDLPFGHRFSGETTDAQEAAIKERYRKGSMGNELDLEYTYGFEPGSEEADMEAGGSFRLRRALGNAVSLSACVDEGQAWETASGGGRMTYCFIRSLNNKPFPTYRQLLSDITCRLNKRCSRCPKEVQTAQLHASHPLGLDDPFVL